MAKSVEDFSADVTVKPNYRILPNYIFPPKFKVREELFGDRFDHFETHWGHTWTNFAPFGHSQYWVRIVTVQLTSFAAR